MLRQLGAAIDFALRGEDYDDSHFNFQVFLAHVYEHKDAVKAAILAPIAAVEALIMYEAPLASLLACSFWQAACSHPPLLASVPLLSLLWLLLHNWRAGRVDQPAVQRAPGLSSLLAAALLPIWWQRPMVAPRPDLRAPDQRAPGGFGGAPTQTALVARRAEEAASAAADKAELQEAAERMEKELKRRRRPSGLLGAVRLTWHPCGGEGGAPPVGGRGGHRGCQGVAPFELPTRRRAPTVVAGAFCQGGREGAG